MSDALFNFVLCAQIVAALFFLALHVRGKQDQLFLHYCFSVLMWCTYKFSQGQLFFLLAWLNSLALFVYAKTGFKSGPFLAACLGLNAFVLLLLITLKYPTQPDLWVPFIWFIDSVYLAMAWFLLRRFSATFNQLEVLNSELKHRIGIAKDNIQQQHQQLAQHEIQAVLDKERSRIYRDLHDDIGANLLSLVHSSRLPEDERLARFALQDLRDTVALNNQNSHNLGDILASICTETLHGCENAQIDLDWQQPDLDHITLHLSQADALRLKRLLRELVALTLTYELNPLSVYWRLQGQQLLLSFNWQLLTSVNGLDTALEQCLCSQLRSNNGDICYPVIEQQYHE